MRNLACVCVSAFVNFGLRYYTQILWNRGYFFCKNLARLELSCAPNFGIQWGKMERFPLGVRQFWIEISVTSYTTYRSSASYLNSLNVSIFTCETETTFNLWYCCKDWINHWLYGVCVKLLQLCPTLCDPMDCSPPGSSVHGTFLARILEFVAMSSSRGSSQHRDQTRISYASCIGRPILYHQRHLESPSLRQLAWFKQILLLF